MISTPSKPASRAITAQWAKSRIVLRIQNLGMPIGFSGENFQIGLGTLEGATASGLYA